MGFWIYLLIAAIFINIFYVLAAFGVSVKRKQDKERNRYYEEDYSSAYATAVLLGILWPFGIPLIIIVGVGYANYYLLNKKVIPFVLRKLGDK